MTPEKFPEANCTYGPPSDAHAASSEWGFNCGPGALCAVLGKTPAELRAHLLDFETKGCTNPTLMRSVLRALHVAHHQVWHREAPHPRLGGAAGPLADQGVPKGTGAWWPTHSLEVTRP